MILLAQILHALGLADRVILTRHVVGHEVDDHFHASLVGTLHQCLELLHTLLHIDCEVRIHVIIVRNGVGRASLTFDDGRMVLGDAVGGIVRLRGVADDACKPDMAHAHLPDFLQGAGREVVHLSTSVLFYRTILLAGGIAIAVETGENLIDNNLTRCHEQKLPY